MSTLQENLNSLNRTFEDYWKLTRKSREDALAKKGKDLSFELYKVFREIPPRAPRAKILGKARGLKYALGNISPKAKVLAARYMGGLPSIIGNEFEIGDSAIDIRSARMGKRGKRIVGGRNGRGGRAASLAEYRSAGFNKGFGSDITSNEHVLNTRNIEVFFELMLRLRGSGSLAAAWLHKRLPRSGATDFHVENVNPEAEVQLQGMADFDTKGEASSFALTNRMPGIAKFPHLAARALEAVRQDMMVYIARKQQEAAQQAARTVR